MVKRPQSIPPSPNQTMFGTQIPLNQVSPELRGLWNKMRALERNIVSLEISVANAKDFFVGLRTEIEQLMRKEIAEQLALKKVAKKYNKSKGTKKPPTPSPP